MMMMITFITQGGEGQGDTSKESTATKNKGRGLEEGANRALMRQVGEEGCGGRGLRAYRGWACLSEKDGKAKTSSRAPKKIGPFFTPK